MLSLEPLLLPGPKLMGGLSWKSASELRRDPPLEFGLEEPGEPAKPDTSEAIWASIEEG